MQHLGELHRTEKLGQCVCPIKESQEKETKTQIHKKSTDNQEDWLKVIFEENSCSQITNKKKPHKTNTVYSQKGLPEIINRIQVKVFRRLPMIL